MEAKDNSDVASGSVSNTKHENKDQYEGAYIKNVNHGITYQLKILTLITWKLLYKANARMRNWAIAKVRKARGFHDLMLQYDDASNDKRMYCFVQIKHKLCLKKNAQDVMPIVYVQTTKKTRKNCFNLYNLFMSYENIIKNFGKSEQIQDLIIFTNWGIDEKISFIMKDENEVEKILSLKEEEGRYRINSDEFFELYPDSDNNCMRDFLKKLVFMVNQPSKPELEELIIEDISETFKNIFYNGFYKNMNEWFHYYKNSKS